MEDEKRLLLKMHPVSKPLDETTIDAVADSAELMKLEAGTVLQRRDEVVCDVYLIIHGRLKVDVCDILGSPIVTRTHSSGMQFGAMAAALGEPAAIDCVVDQRATLLKLDYQTFVELTRRFPEFHDSIRKLIATSVRSLVLGDKTAARSRVVSIYHQSEDTRHLSRRVVQRLVDLGESVCVITDKKESDPIESVRYRTPQQASDKNFPREMMEFVAASLTDGRLIVAAGSETTPTQKRNMLEKSEEFYCVVTPHDWQQALAALGPVISEQPTWREKVCLVWVLKEGEVVPLTSDFKSLVRDDFKLGLSEPSSTEGGILKLGFDRWIHRLRGLRIGVALGGGAARGMAHLGVLKALEKEGIVIDMIAGTSAGAMTGMTYAANLEVDFSIDSFSRDLTPSRIFRSIPRGEQWYLLYKYRTGQWDPMLRKYLGDQRLEQLPLQIRTITVDLISARAVIRDQGDAVHAILESINLPVLAKPINRNGQALVDGGLIDNVPADVLANQGCNFVIAVSVTASLEYEFANNRPDTPPEQIRRASTIQTLMRSHLVQNHNINSIGVAPADFVIEPDVTDFDLTEFKRTKELAAVGEATTLKSIEEIRNRLHRMDPHLYPLR